MFKMFKRSSLAGFHEPPNKQHSWRRRSFSIRACYNGLCAVMWLRLATWNLGNQLSRPLQLCLAISALLPPCTQSCHFEIKIQDLHGLGWLSMPWISPHYEPKKPVSGIVQLFLKSIPLVLSTNLSLEALKITFYWTEESLQHTTFM